MSGARAKWVAPTIEVAIGTVVGYATWQLTDAENAVTGLLSIAVGLLTTLVIGSINGHLAEEARTSEQSSRMDLLLSRLAVRLGEATEMAAHLQHGLVSVPRDRTAKAWLDLLWRCSSRYWGTVYTAPEEVVETSLFELGHSVLGAKVRVDQVDARRIFIIEETDELNRMRARLEAQMASGIQIRWIEKAQVEAHPYLREQINAWSTFDITVLDSRVIWLLHLDGNRRIESGTLEIDTDKARRFEETYRLLWDTAKPLDSPKT
jgi:hypothetical protein